MPLHTKASHFAASGLFIGITSFEELEKRISSINENKEKGDAFEVFAEAYFATQRSHEIGQAWPLNAVPLNLLRRLKLPIKDYGVDGITQTILGGHQVYQVKFRSNRTPLTWEELSTFMGLSDSPEIQTKIIITNCDDLPEVINERHNFFCIRGSDLDRLTAEDFRVIEAWISGAALPPRKRHAPREHQHEALDRILPALSTHDRVSVIMACGTGKTLVTLWTAEQVSFSTILVLLPSLALLRQMLHEWKDQADMKFAPLCVCSDPSVKGDDAISTAQSDLDFEVSTNPGTVRRFLDTPFDGTKVVFCTYQSAKVVGSAMKPDESFDLGIFDEAHKTAGREGRNYGYALEDKNLRIAKRLFVTATPRHYDPSKRNKEGEAAIAFSMDNTAVYGPQVYTLPFSEAARRGIICNYKVIISVITSEQVNDETLSRGTVEIQGDEIRARQVANQIALRDAVDKYGVSKIFTFHSTVKSAASFTSDGSEGVRTHLPSFATHHVSGAMPTAKRERIMREFRGEKRAVISNARCLTEGVDVPAVDMVAFLSPRKSKVDIVQAIGRAMRRSGDKEVGYVLVPLYLEQIAGESMEEAIARANFEEVWDILQSLQEQDEVLAELIKEKGFAKARGKGFDDERISHLIDFMGDEIGFEKLKEAISTQCLERITRLPWLPYEQARKFARSLNIGGKTEWVQYCKGKLPDKPRLPKDIPAAPSNIYKAQGWVSWGDWFGTNFKATFLRAYRPFPQARDFIRSLGFLDIKEWRSYCRGTHAVHRNKPEDIPANPDKIYASDGWVGYGDWLGTGSIANFNKKFLPFEEAREYARSLKLKGAEEWNAFCKGKTIKKEKRPNNIPSNPGKAYKGEGWAGFGDWLGSNNIQTGLRSYREFKDARNYVRNLKLKSYLEWRSFCSGRMLEIGRLPKDIPSNPNLVYSKTGDWAGFGDWLGTCSSANRGRQFLSFLEARQFARSLNLRGQSDWFRFCKENKNNNQRFPANIPTNPNVVFKNRGWIGFRDWLGTS